MDFKKYFIIIVILILVYYLINIPKVALKSDLIINYPNDLEEVSGVINVNGKANPNYKEIYYRIDLSEWELANGVSKWNFDLDTTKLSKGLHVIYVKAEDKVKAVRIKVV